MEAGFVASPPQVIAEGFRIFLVWGRFQPFQCDRTEWQKGNAALTVRQQRQLGLYVAFGLMTIWLPVNILLENPLYNREYRYYFIL